MSCKAHFPYPTQEFHDSRQFDPPDQVCNKRGNTSSEIHQFASSNPSTSLKTNHFSALLEEVMKASDSCFSEPTVWLSIEHTHYHENVVTTLVPLDLIKRAG